MKKWLSVLSALAVFTTGFLTLSGCKGNDGGSASGENEEGRYTKPVHFTTIRQDIVDANMPSGWTLEENPYADYMKSELNVTYEVLWASHEYNSKLLLEITSGKIPDIFLVNDYATYRMLYENDLIADLTDAYEEYATDTMKSIYNAYSDSVMDLFKKNGRLMALPNLSPGYQESLLWVRKDWLDLLGLEPPKTIEEIATVAKAFVEQDPGGNGQGNTIGLNVQLMPTLFDTYRNCYGLEMVASSMGAYPGQWMADESGKISYGSIQPAFKQVMQLALNWIDSGVIDKERFLSQNWEQSYANVTSGLAGMWFFPWSWVGMTEFYKNNPRAELICYPAPLDNDGNVTYWDDNKPFESMIVVRKGYENPEVLFKVINLIYDMNNSINQEGYEALAPMRESNTAWYYIQPIPFTIRAYDSVPEGSKKIDAYLANGTKWDGFTENDQRTCDLISGWLDGSDTSAAAWSAYMGYQARSAQKNETTNPVTQAEYFVPAEYDEIWSYLQSMEHDFVYNVMKGEDSIDSFDTFVQDWKEAGGDTLLAAMQAQHDGE